MLNLCLLKLLIPLKIIAWLAGNTPLFLSLLSADVSTTKYLLDHGADPNKATQGGVCPLHQAAGSGSTFFSLFFSLVQSFLLKL
jgi:ankyrin repeat protein